VYNSLGVAVGTLPLVV
jgi:hypothetical protein